MMDPDNVVNKAMDVSGACMHPLNTAAIPIIMKLMMIKWVPRY